MKPTKAPPFSLAADTGGAKRTLAEEGSETEEQAFHAAQQAALADLRAYHASRPRRKR